MAAGVCWADTFTVRNTNDSGPGSLRSAITRANTNIGPDDIVFRPGLVGKTIRPSTMLPAITDSGTSINGDIDGDGAPDIGLDGSLQSAGSLLRVSVASNCTIAGLAINRSRYCGITVTDSSYVTIRSCHIGVNRAGTTRLRNQGSDIHIAESHHVTVGGTSPTDRNIICGGGLASVNPGVWVPKPGIEIDRSGRNTIIGNYFGIRRNGSAALDGGTGHYGVRVHGNWNVIGGRTAGERNVFGGLSQGVVLQLADSTTICGNYFGLLPDGDTNVPIKQYGVWVRKKANSNVIGGSATGARNVFAGDAIVGVYFNGRANEGNKVQGNYFGCNASGTRQRLIRKGVEIWIEAQTIGGPRAKAGNYFTPKSRYCPTCGVAVYEHGSGSVVRHNTFGKLPNGNPAHVPPVAGVQSWNATIDALDNTFATADYGLAVQGAPANPRVFRNRFLRCDTAVWIQPGARCRMGNLGNTKTSDDGGNRFRSTVTWHVRNESASRILCEGNDFGTTSRAAIDAKIWDRRDDGSLGRVDFNPLMGGIAPTGAADPVLALTGTTALATKAGGAEIVFSLSAPADVTVDVLNIAGRPVAMVAREVATEAGAQRFVWSGQTQHGVPAPPGAYLVRIAARGTDGQQMQALSRIRLGR